ncbi:MAG: hypothetical protein U0T82_15935 [Bacteroidales bacterium]
MKKILYLFSALFILCTFHIKAQTASELVDLCKGNSGDDATYLQDFQVELAAAKPNEKQQPAKFSMVLKKNTRYRFSVCNSESNSANAILQLFDENRMMGSTLNAATGKEYTMFDFNCTKTGVYHVFVFFPDGKSGTAVGILSFIEIL